MCWPAGLFVQQYGIIDHLFYHWQAKTFKGYICSYYLQLQYMYVTMISVSVSQLISVSMIPEVFCSRPKNTWLPASRYRTHKLERSFELRKKIKTHNTVFCHAIIGCFLLHAYIFSFCKVTHEI